MSAGGKKVVILHDEQASDSNLAKMIARCRSAFAGEVTVVDINDLNIKASCRGCLECGGNYRCFYTGKDGYIEFYKSTVMTADVLVYAGTMVDRYLSARWKTFFDRAFFNTHTPVLVDKQVALVVSGPLGQTPNLMEIFEGFFQYQGANIVGVVSDESGDSAELDRLLDGLMTRALASAQAGDVRPQNFLGVAGMKVFRDDMYGRLRVIFPADHNAYRRSGLYKTFPQRQLGTRMLNTFGAPIINLPPIRKKFDPMIKPQMVASHKKAVAKY
jgi:multimeric flavodoxin WrbA